MVRFFTKDQLHEDIYAVGDGKDPKVVLLLGRSGTHRFRNPAHVEIESSSWSDFRRAICYGCCEKGTIDWGYLCDEGECKMEVIPS